MNTQDYLCSQPLAEPLAQSEIGMKAEIISLKRIKLTVESQAERVILGAVGKDCKSARVQLATGAFGDILNLWL